jgi:murein DD-endopeptidase MepM/ murein hydrolase activator NlpD
MIPRFILTLLAATTPLCAALLDWPTENKALLEGRPEDFYMYVDRNFEGVESKPWEGGSYGYVRGPQRVGAEIVYGTLHEGIDIAPVHRDAAGNPLDDVRSCAAGTVVHVSHEAGASNYGRYVVIRHLIEGSPIYTLYAHLSTISAQSGQKVAQGEVIGKMGFTGAGINRERAHLHLEIAVLLNEDFEAWYHRYFSGSPNKHGIYHGYNLVGMEPAAILLESAKNPAFSLKEHIRNQDVAYQITIPDSPNLSIIRNYPWIVPDGEPASPRGWTVSFTQYGVPVKAVAANQPPLEPRLEWVKETPYAYHAATRGIIAGSKGSPRLTDSGHRFVELISGTR